MWRLALALTFGLVSGCNSSGGAAPNRQGVSGRGVENWTSVPGPEMLRRLPFQPGVSHVAGRYRFDPYGSFLVEGAKRISDMGSGTVFLYLDSDFRSLYTDGRNDPWSGQTPRSLKELAQTAPYREAFALPFNTIVLTVFSFGNGTNVFRPGHRADFEAVEEAEIHDLAAYLLTAYAGSGKIFILKNWEGDWFSIGAYDRSQSATADRFEDTRVWLQARQRGVTRARNEIGTRPGVQVYHAAEVNLLLDTAQGRQRLLNTVIPFVGADMLSYSSYEAVGAGSSLSEVETSLRTALQLMDQAAPDPQNLGRKRLMLGEFGVAENDGRSAADTEFRAQGALDQSRGFGISYAFFWEIFDNVCLDPSRSGTPAQLADPVERNREIADASLLLAASAYPVGDPLRPTNNHCAGFGLVRPDGSHHRSTTILTDAWAAIKGLIPEL